MVYLKRLSREMRPRRRHLDLPIFMAYAFRGEVGLQLPIPDNDSIAFWESRQEGDEFADFHATFAGSAMTMSSNTIGIVRLNSANAQPATSRICGWAARAVRMRKKCRHWRRL